MAIYMITFPTKLRERFFNADNVLYRLKASGKLEKIMSFLENRIKNGNGVDREVIFSLLFCFAPEHDFIASYFGSKYVNAVEKAAEKILASLHCECKKERGCYSCHLKHYCNQRKRGLIRVVISFAKKLINILQARPVAM